VRQRTLGKTDLRISELVLGTWGLSGDAYGPVDEREQDAVIRRAQGLGITAFETASSYASGSMEKRLGALLGHEASCAFITKIGTDLDSRPARKRFDREHLRKACEQSAERLKRSTLDVVLLHNPAETTLERAEACDALRELAAQGAIKTWGVSAGTREIAQKAVTLGAPVVQVVYNPFLRNDLEGVSLDPSTTGVLVRSILAHGLLAGLWPGNKTFAYKDHRSERWTPDQFQARLRQLAALSGALSSNTTSLRAVAVRFALSNDRVSAAVLGPRSSLQLDQLVRDAGTGPTYLDNQQLSRLNSELERYGVRQ
jgi:aryl-alcohol dehydrogenase-like predicted oxidoreductase